MAPSPFSLGLDVVPFFFKFRDSIFGHGFVATVETTGRAMCEKEDGEYIVAGVEPGGMAASGETAEAALLAFRQMFRAILMDIAAEAPDFDAFHAEVRRFVHETSPRTVADWNEAVIHARAKADQSPDVARVNPDTPASVAISFSTDLVPEQNVIDEPSQLIAAQEMAGAGFRWSDVQAMLNACAAGWSAVVKEHHRWISFGGATWRAFPRGPGANPRDFEVEAGQVRKLVRHLGISMKCAKKHLPALGPIKETDS